MRLGGGVRVAIGVRAVGMYAALVATPCAGKASVAESGEDAAADADDAGVSPPLEAAPFLLDATMPSGDVEAGPVSNDASQLSDALGDPHNCGIAGHDCLGGACLADVCQPVVLATLIDSSVSSFAIDTTSVYWTTAWSGSGNDVGLISGTVAKCPITGCVGKPTVLATQQAVAQGLVVNGPTLYWLDYNAGTLMQCGIDCTDDALTFYKWPNLASEGFAANATEAFFSGFLGGGLVQDCPIVLDAGCAAPTTFASGQQMPDDIVLSGSSVYWINIVQMVGGRKSILEIDAGVLTCPVSGCDDGGPTALAEGLDRPASLVVSGATAYWVESGSVVACNVTGCGGAPTPVVSLPGLNDSIGALAVDGTELYFGAVVGVDPPLSWEIRSCSLPECPQGSTLLASTPLGGGSWVPQVLVDATRIYFASGDGSQILALAK